VHHFLKKVAKANGLPVKSVNHEALKYLYQYDWIGNVRELENVIERAVILCDKDEIQPQDLPEELFQKRLPGITEEVTGERALEPELRGSGDLHSYAGLNQRQAKAINFIKNNGYITNDYYIQINQISDRHARRDLSQMVEMDIVARVGRGRSTRYVLK
jgi:two-component system NtrC family response regulator